MIIRSISVAALIAALLSSTALADNLSGTWMGNVTCRGQYIEPQPWPLTIVVTGSSGRYTLSATTPNSAGAGTINGRSVQFAMSTMLNALHATGTVSGNRMSGSYVQGGSGPCSWFASRVGGVPDGQPHLVRPQDQLVPKKPSLSEGDIQKAVDEKIRNDPDLRNVIVMDRVELWRRGLVKSPNGPQQLRFQEIKEYLKEKYKDWLDGLGRDEMRYLERRIRHCQADASGCAVASRG